MPVVPFMQEAMSHLNLDQPAKHSETLCKTTTKHTHMHTHTHTHTHTHKEPWLVLEMGGEKFPAQTHYFSLRDKKGIAYSIWIKRKIKTPFPIWSLNVSKCFHMVTYLV
jgi:hypothetical protein